MAGILAKYEQYLDLTIEPEAPVSVANVPPAQPIILSNSEQQRLAKGCVLLPPDLWRTGLASLGEATTIQDTCKAQKYIARTGYQQSVGFFVAAPGSGLGQR